MDCATACVHTCTTYLRRRPQGQQACALLFAAAVSCGACGGPYQQCCGHLYVGVSLGVLVSYGTCLFSADASNLGLNLAYCCVAFFGSALLPVSLYDCSCSGSKTGRLPQLVSSRGEWGSKRHQCSVAKSCGAKEFARLGDRPLHPAVQRALRVGRDVELQVRVWPETQPLFLLWLTKCFVGFTHCCLWLLAPLVDIGWRG